MFHAIASLYQLTSIDEVTMSHDRWRPFIKEIIGVVLDEATQDPMRITIRVTTPDNEFDLKPWEVYPELMHNTYVPVQQGNTISVIVGYTQDDGSIPNPSLKLAYYSTQ